MMRFNPESFFYYLTLAAYTLTLILLLASNRLPALNKQAKILISLGVSAHTLTLFFRVLTIGRLPVANLYEFTLLLSWGTVLIFLFLQKRYPVSFLGIPVLLVILSLLIYAGSLKQEARPIMPALQSYWLKLHVAVAILAYGSFTISFGAGLLLLLKGKLRIPDNSQWEPMLEQLMNKAIAFGFPFMTLVLITGSIWAEQVWGAWWSWDPKETWALITWIIYAIYLHGRYSRRWRGKRSAWMVVMGFGAVVFTLFGVTWLMSGLHSYI